MPTTVTTTTVTTTPAPLTTRLIMTTATERLPRPQWQQQQHLPLWQGRLRRGARVARQERGAGNRSSRSAEPLSCR